MYSVEKSNIETVQALLPAGADVNISNKDNGTSFLMAVSIGHIDIVQILLATGVMSMLL